jgi:DNA-binding transcriptional LysR family regulator
MLTILTLVASGFGIAFVPESFRKVAIPGVAYRDMAGPPRNAQLAVVRRRDNTAPAVKAFMRTLRTTLSREEGTTQNAWNRAGQAGKN